jgi:phosphopantothenoylcysteine decarboxylase
VVRAWDFSKFGFFALAMNTFMYEHFLTEKQVKILTEEFKFISIPSVVKKLKCGDYGIGGIADTEVIHKMVCDKVFTQIFENIN